MGRQINFYLMEDDLLEIDMYIEKNNLAILYDPLPTKKLHPVPSLLEKNIPIGKYIVSASHLDEVKIKYIETQKYYRIDSSNSPVIEFSQPGYHNGNIKLRGRVYYTKENFINKEYSNKDETFIKMADSFFRWMKRNFKNVKLKGYEDFLVTERTLAWLEESKDRELSLNNIFSEAIQKSGKKQLVA